MKYGVFAITRGGVELGRRLVRVLPTSRLHLFNRFETRRGEKGFKDLKEEVKEAFGRYDGLIFIMAIGIVVRTVTPFLRDKTKDPAVVVVDERGRFAISLISGHLGGANGLAREIASAIGARPVITTATDVKGLPCIEDIARRFNLVIEEIKGVKYVNSAIVNGRRVAFVDVDTKRREGIKKEVGCGKLGVDFKFYKHISRTAQLKNEVFVIVSNNSLPHILTSTSYLLLRPKDLVVGIGCDKGVRLREVKDAYFEVLKRWGVSPLSIRNLATIDIKKNEKGLLNFAKRYNLPIEFYPRDELAKMPLPSGTSRFVIEKVGVGGVCEPSALLSSGAKRIWVKKQKVGRVTIAIAKVPFTS